MTWTHFLLYWPFVRRIHLSLIGTMLQGVGDLFDVRLDNFLNKHTSDQWFKGHKPPCDIIWYDLIWCVVVYIAMDWNQRVFCPIVVFTYLFSCLLSSVASHHNCYSKRNHKKRIFRLFQASFIFTYAFCRRDISLDFMKIITWSLLYLAVNQAIEIILAILFCLKGLY